MVIAASQDRDVITQVFSLKSVNIRVPVIRYYGETGSTGSRTSAARTSRINFINFRCEDDPTVHVVSFQSFR
jgi:hypothetical protein